VVARRLVFWPLLPAIALKNTLGSGIETTAQLHRGGWCACCTGSGPT
jgi:hypothetical protein